jgi:hypothetical protein
LAADGSVFFTTADPLNLRDLNGGKTDVYQWSGEEPKLISTGISPFDSRLLSVGEDRRDVYFFTHDVLAAQDRNGNLVKIYDAREGGGFYVQPTPPVCKASDECHGPGTQPPPPPDIGTYKGTGGQATHTPPKRIRCRGNRIKRRGRCVKKPNRRRQGKKRRAAGRSHRKQGRESRSRRNG